MLKHNDSLEFKWLVQHYFVLSTSPFPPTAIKIHHALLHVQQQCIKFSPVEVFNFQTWLYTTWDPCTIKKKKKCIFYLFSSSFSYAGWCEALISWCRNATLRYDCSLGMILKCKKKLLECSCPFWILKKDTTVMVLLEPRFSTSWHTPTT